MVLLRQTQLLSLASVMLYLIPSGVLCDGDRMYPKVRDEGTGTASSHYKVMSIPDVCVRKVKKMLENVATFCEVDPVMSCQDVASNLASLLQSEQAQSKNCKVQLNAVKSLLERLLQQLSQSKERIRAMSGIAIRYQGNRTSLNDLLNNNHQQLSGTVDEIIQDIRKWNMNTSRIDVTYRDLSELETCNLKLKKAEKSFTNALSQLQACQVQLANMKDSEQGYEKAKIVADLNRTTEELKVCEQKKGECDEELETEREYKSLLLKMNTELETSFNETRKELFEVRLDLEGKLEACYNNLNVNMENTEAFNKAVANLEKQIGNDTKSLQAMFEGHISGARNTNTLLKEVREKYEALRSVCKTVDRIKRTKITQLSSCEKEKSNLDKEKSDLENSVDKCKEEINKLKEDIDVYQTDLNSCNETNKQQKLKINETVSENMQLMQNISNLDEIAQKCNASLQKQNEVNQDQQAEIKDLKNELELKENRINELENDKVELNTEINSLKEALEQLRKEKEEMLKELKIKNDSLDGCEEHLRSVKVQYANYKSSCESDLNASREKMEEQQHRFSEELNKYRENNTNLVIEINSLKTEKQNYIKENENLQYRLMDETNELKECIGDKLNLTNTIVFKNRDLEDLQRDYDNMNLTAKLSQIKISTRISELEIKLRYLEYLLKSNRNEIKLLEEYGVILIMLINKNSDMLSLLKETFQREGDSLAPVIDDRLESLLRRLLRSVEDHHSRIYTQLLQMKPYMDKVVPIRVRRQVQRGRPVEVALLGAAKENNMTEVGVLLDVGANVNVQDESGLTPLHWAAMQGNTDVAELLLCRGAEPNIQAQGKGIKTPLHLAAEYGHSDTVLILLDFGSNIEARALDHATPLLYAANRGNEQVVSILLLRGADIRSTNAHNKNILQLSEKYPKVVRVIHEYIARNTNTPELN